MRMRFLRVFRYALPFLFLGAVAVLARQCGLGGMLDEQWMDTHVRGNGIAGWGIFFVVCGVMSSLGVPRQIFAFLGGYVFGVALGLVLSTLAATVGCAVLYTYARRFSPSAVSGFLQRGKIGVFERFFRESPFSTTLVIRLLPFGNNTVANLFAGTAHISAPAFIGGSCLGFVPQMLIFALLGAGMQAKSTTRFLLSGGLFVLSAIVALLLYRRSHGALLARAGLGGEDNKTAGFSVKESSEKPDERE